MPMTLEMPSDVDQTAATATQPADEAAAQEAADILDQADATGSIDEGADYSEPLGDGSCTAEPQADAVETTATVEPSADPPAPTEKKKRGRKKKAASEGDNKPADPTPAESAIGPIVQPGAMSKSTRGFQIAKLTAELVEVVLDCQEHEAAINHHKSELKRLDEQRAELSIELRSLRESEQWQPPLFDPPKENRPDGAAVGPEVESAQATTAQAEPEGKTAVAAADSTTAPPPADPDAWRSGKIKELGLTEKMTDKLESHAGGPTIGHLEDYRVRIANRTDKWPPRVGPEAVTKIENAILDWLKKNQPQAAANGQPSPPAATTAAAAVPNFDQWESLTEEQQRDYICARAAAYIDDDQDNSLATKHHDGSKFWDSGFEAAQRGMKVSECPYVPGPEMDDWLRGFLAQGAVEKYEPTKKPAKAKGEKKTAAAKAPALTSLDDL